MPFIQDVRRFEKRILKWDGDPRQITTVDKKFVMIDTTARWRIQDPLLFLTKVRDMQGAFTRLDDLLDAEMRLTISKHPLVEAVRTTNRKMAEEEDAAEDEADRAGHEKISVGRQQISKMILDSASEEVAKFGITLVDFRIKKINYVEQVRQKVYDRMISERMKIAERYRSEGLGKKSEIDGQRQKELLKINSEAYQKAEAIKGKAEAEATRLYAEAYSTDPEFYEFIETLSAYKETLDSETMLILSTDSPFLKYLKEGSERKGR
jgi:membrane protease subunit HflC